MLREFVICIVIIIVILFGNNVTENYTKESVEHTSKSLNQLREEIKKDNISNDVAKQQIIKIHDEWNDRHNKLAYYIEHDELEKVETDLTALKSYIETEEYEEAISELDKGVFVLKHIEEKNEFNLQNIF